MRTLVTEFSLEIVTSTNVWRFLPKFSFSKYV